jgi:DNA invertase Pin-like site-specific DNA recombinase
MKIGYARVSTTDQSADTQVERLEAAGCHIVKQEKVSGRSREGRPELQAVLDLVRPGDTLVVVKLDRLGRSTRDVLNLVHELDQRRASLHILEPEISTAGPLGKMVLTVLGMVAEMELGFIKDRQAAGIARAKQAGIYRGRQATINPTAVRQRHSAGMKPAAIATDLGISARSVFRILADSQQANMQ